MTFITFIHSTPLWMLGLLVVLCIVLIVLCLSALIELLIFFIAKEENKLTHHITQRTKLVSAMIMGVSIVAIWIGNVPMEFTYFLHSIPLWLLSVIVVGSMTLLTLSMAVIINWLMGHTTRKQHNSVVGLIGAQVGLLYGVVLGFFVITLWERYDRTYDLIQKEASSLNDIARSSRTYPKIQERAVRQAVEEYISVVLYKEWPLQQKGYPSLDAWHAVERLHRLLLDYHPTTPTEQVTNGEILHKMNDVLMARDDRLTKINKGFDPIIWKIIIIVTLIVLAYVCLLGMEHVSYYVVLLSLMSLFMGVIFTWILDMEYPLIGTRSIEPIAFQNVLEQLQRLDKEQPPS